MANHAKLTADIRTGTGRSAVKKIKSSGYIPAVIYGAGADPQALQIPADKVSAMLSHAVGESFLVDLEIAGGRSTLALVPEIQHHPVTREILHLDLLAVKAGEKVTAEIPVEPKGEAKGVKSGGGVLEQLAHTLEVEALPADLPQMLHVDVSDLAIGDHITVADLKLPAGVVAQAEDEAVVFLVSAPRVAEEETTEDTPTAPEVIREKKETAPEDQEKE